MLWISSSPQHNHIIQSFNKENKHSNLQLDYFIDIVVFRRFKYSCQSNKSVSADCSLVDSKSALQILDRNLICSIRVRRLIENVVHEPFTNSCYEIFVFCQISFYDSFYDVLGTIKIFYLDKIKSSSSLCPEIVS